MAWAIPIAAAVAGSVASSAASKAFSGTPEKHRNISMLTKQQQPLLNQAIASGMGPGAGGAFGEAADYYRGNLSNDPYDFQAFAAPEMRRYNEETIPGLAEQFAGMGAGGLSSSGFRNAAVGAGTDLSERLAQIRANLRQQSAQGLTNIGQIGLGNYSQDRMVQPGTEGAFGKIAETAGNALAQYGTKKFEDWYNKPAATQSTAGTTSPYGGGSTYQRQPLPEFNYSTPRSY